MKNHSFLASICIVFMIANLSMLCSADKSSKPRILVFSKTDGFRHSSIAAGKKAIQKLSREHNFLVDATEDAHQFTKSNLKKYAAVVFLNTTGNVLNETQQKAFKYFINAGGGFLGIHAASDTEYQWPWYGRLVGAHFKDHPSIQKAKINIHYDKNFPVFKSFPHPWKRTDEWYDFRSIPQDVHVLMSIDKHSYKGSTMGGGSILWFGTTNLTADVRFIWSLGIPGLLIMNRTFLTFF